MNVLYVHDRPSGGAGESLYQLVESRVEEGKSVLVFSEEGFIGDRFEDLKLDIPPTYKSVRSWLLYKRQKAALLSYLRLLAAIPWHAPFFSVLLKLARQQRIDIVHTNCIYILEGAIVAKMLGLPHVWQVRELVDLDYYQYNLPKKTVVSWLNRLSTFIICNSDRTARGLERLGAEPAKLRVIHNIVDESNSVKDLRVLLNLNPDVKLVGTVGWVTPNKRIEDFVELASRFTDWGDKVRFLIIGGWGGRQPYNAKIKEAIEGCPNHSNIIHTGILKDASSYLASLDVLVCPCFTESFGRTVGEALAAGTPAIGVRGTAVEEIIDHGENGFLVENGDVTAMEHFTRMLLEDEALRREFGKHGRMKVRDNFSRHVLLQKFEGLYREAVALKA